MITKEEPATIKSEAEAPSRKFTELTEDGPARINGGITSSLLSTDNPFRGIFDGNTQTVHLNIGLGPEEYDCSSTID